MAGYPLVVNWSYRPALDGLRSIAVYLVLLFHAGMHWMSGGFVGVDLFFVLSGFLVSNVILSEIDERGSLRLGRFYARRVRRLLPAAVVVVFSTAAVFTLVTSVVRRLPMVADAKAALLYYANWRFLSQENDYFATDIDKSPYLHFWSLSIEEQFYFVFPAVLMVLVVLSRRRRWVLPVGIGALLVLSLASQAYWTTADTNHAYYGTDARLYQLLAGALLAVALRSAAAARLPDATATRWATAAGLGGLALVLLVASGLVDVSASWRGIGAAVGSVLLIAGVMRGDGTVLARLLSRPTPVYLGKISYGTYLWHWPVLLLVQEFIDVRPLFLAAIGGAVATGLAALSYQLLEMPIRRSTWLHGFQWPVVLVGVTASALVAVLVLPTMLQTTRPPQLAASGVRGAAGDAAESRSGPRVPAGLDFKAISLDWGKEHTCSTPADCVVVPGDGAKVLLVGDSHARMLEPMFERLARDHGFELSVNIRSQCPWQAGIVNFNQDPAVRQGCVAQRGPWYRDVLPGLKPDLVVVVSNSYDNEKRYGDAFKRVGGSDESLSELLHATTNETLKRFTDVGARSLIVLNTLETQGLDPLDCLARAQRVSECDIHPRLDESRSNAYYKVADVTSDDIWSVDINPVLCPGAPSCRPILDGIVVWRDGDHITASIGIALRDKVWKVIEETGVLDGLETG